MITIDNLSYHYDQKIILQDVNATLEAGTITAILGTNGAGKSTLLHCIGGSLIPTFGKILLDNKPLQQYSLTQLSLKRAVLTQNTSITFPFSALDIVLMGRIPYHNKPIEKIDRDVAMEVLDYVEASHLKNRIFPTLSGGEQQRIHIARVLAQIWQKENTCLLLDEPTSALDLRHQFQLLQLLNTYTKTYNTTVILILHDLNLAYHYTDYTLFLVEANRHIYGRSHNVVNAKNVSSIYKIPIEHALLHLTGICTNKY